VEADALYMLLVDLNIRVRDSLDQRDREFTLLGAYMNAIARGGFAKPRHLGGQELLFCDSISKLNEQLRILDLAVNRFNRIAEHCGFEKLDLNQVRVDLGSEADDMVSSWTGRAHLEAIAAFGDWNAWRAGLKRVRVEREQQC
jgi:hypothetical protein